MTETAELKAPKLRETYFITKSKAGNVICHCRIAITEMLDPVTLEEYLLELCNHEVVAEGVTERELLASGWKELLCKGENEFSGIMARYEERRQKEFALKKMRRLVSFEATDEQ